MSSVTPTPTVPSAPVIAGTSAMLALVLLKVSPLTFVDPDVWHQMSLAREIWASGQVPLADTFSYTPTLPLVVHHEWGAGLLYLAVATIGGGAGFLAFKYLLVAGVLGFTVRAAVCRGATKATLVACALPAVLLAHYGFTTIRPQVLTLLALAVLLNFLAPLVSDKRLWLWVPLQLLWINLHAGFVVGFGFLVLTAVERAMRRELRVSFVALTVVSAALVFINPWGPDYVVYLAEGLFMDRPNVPEWAPLWSSFELRWADLASWASMLVVGLYAIGVRGFAACRGAPLVAIALLNAMLHQRHVSILAVTWFAIVPAWLATTPLDEAIRRFFKRNARWVTGLGALGVVAFGGIALLRAPFSLQVPTDLDSLRDGAPGYPVGAADYLEENGVRGNVMTPFVEGAYMIWRLHPQGVLVSYDGRYEVCYPPAVSEAHLRFYSGSEGWASVPTEYPTDLILLPRTSPVLAGALALRDWRVVYGDDLYVLIAPEGSDLPFTDRRGQLIEGSFP